MYSILPKLPESTRMPKKHVLWPVQLLVWLPI